MYSFLSWLVMAAVAVVAVVFSLINRFTLDLNLWPFPYLVTAPLWLVVLLSAFGGFVVGGAVMWLSGGEARGRARAAEKRVRTLEQDLLQEQRRRTLLEDASRKAAQQTLPAPGQDSSQSSSAA